jgi:hypothetical protein
VPLVGVSRTVVDGDVFARFDEAFKAEVGLPTLAEVGVPQQLGVGAVFMSMIRHDGILGTDGVAVNGARSAADAMTYSGLALG